MVLADLTVTSCQTLRCLSCTDTAQSHMTAPTFVCHCKNFLLLLTKAYILHFSPSQANGTFIVQPSQTKPSGECLETKANLTLSFLQGPNNYFATNNSLNLFAARIGYCYSCKKETLYMGNGLYLDITKDQMQAFNISNGEFGKPDFCPADQPDYRVAIAVGITLLVLIVIVLIVYLLGRRRRTAGYQSL
uniref:Uncharacterized protein n=1 Tax=Cyprinodon variegatus TaxID=28743 RepID=A0A3Q2DQB5_CYPVA